MSQPARGAAAENEPILLRRVEDGIATLTLNRPQARNALSMALMAALIEALAALKAEPAVKVVVLAASGPAFCAGHDLKELRSDPRREAYEAVFARCSALMLALTRLAKPVIARVHGMATAAGCQLVASCDLAVAAEEARFATPGVAKRASLAATARSQLATSWQPAAVAMPWTRAITGLGRRVRASISSLQRAKTVS